jgi:hypothetical protein
MEREGSVWLQDAQSTLMMEKRQERYSIDSLLGSQDNDENSIGNDDERLIDSCDDV